MLNFHRPSGARPGLTRFIARELASYALHGILAPISRPGPLPDAEAGPTILFVHGHGGGPGAFLLLERALRKRGFSRFAWYGFRSSGSVSSLAEGLRRHVAGSLPGDGPLHVIGHSLGGVIARLWLQELGGRARAVSFTTLSSPHQGLGVVPAAGMVPVIRELLPGSPLLGRLERTSPVLGGLPCLSLVSSRDHFVRPWERAGFAGARLLSVAHAGHVGLLFSGEVAGLVADHLEATPRRR